MDFFFMKSNKKKINENNSNITKVPKIKLRKKIGILFFLTKKKHQDSIWQKVGRKIVRYKNRNIKGHIEKNKSLQI